MKLDSVLELQESLLRGLGPGPRLAAQTARESSAARRATDIAPEQPDIALGVAPKEGGDYQLAVRVQRRALLTSARLQAVIEAASGEAQVRYVGRIEKLDASVRDRHRPLVPGISVGHRDITAGTLGCFVQIDAGLAILSNNHVLADENRAEIGDAIIQPGQYDDGETSRDTVAELAEYVPLHTTGINRVDAAVATLTQPRGAHCAELLGVGAIGSAIVAPEDALGLPVLKVGRTTGITHGVVTAINVSKIVIEYDTSRTMRFDGQIEIEASDEQDFSLGGDSGALIVAAAGLRPVGLLFAGSDQGGHEGGGVTYANPLSEVLDALNAALYLES